MRIVTLTLSLTALTGCDCGGIDFDPNVDTVNTNETIAGDANSTTTVDDVAVEEANIDADTDVESEVDVDADAHVEDSGNVDIVVNIGGSGGDNENEENAGDAGDDGDDGDDGDGGDDGDDGDEGDNSGGASALGDGIALEASYQGPVNERVDLTPGFDDELAASLDSVEWLVRGPVLGAPTIFDDDDGFSWGAPQSDDTDDALDEYTLAVRFGTDALAPIAWTTESSWCINGVCDGRAVSAACSATIVLRAWRDDGTSREVTVAHESARPTCWQ